MTTKVVNIHADKYDVYIGKAGKGQDGYFDNPFRLRNGEKRGATIEKYKTYFYERLETDCGVPKHVRIGKISEEEEHL